MRMRKRAGLSLRGTLSLVPLNTASCQRCQATTGPSRISNYENCHVECMMTMCAPEWNGGCAQVCLSNDKVERTTGKQLALEPARHRASLSMVYLGWPDYWVLGEHWRQADSALGSIMHVCMQSVPKRHRSEFRHRLVIAACPKNASTLSLDTEVESTALLQIRLPVDSKVETAVSGFLAVL